MITTQLFRKIHLPFLLLAVGAVFISGCNNGPKHYPVAGTVTLDGVPLSDGEIIFFPIPDGPPDSGLLEDGTFSLMCLPGEKRVQVTAVRDHPTKKVAGFSPGQWIPAPVNFVPDRYRGKDSELTIDIPRGGDTKIVLELFSKDEK